MIEKVKINQITANPNNPRNIKDLEFKKLVKSLKQFPEMLELRPIVVNKHNLILGGNMRYRAAIEAGLEDVYIIKALGFTQEQEDEFIIKDNISFGNWDWDILANEWEQEELYNFGLIANLSDNFEEEKEILQQDKVIVTLTMSKKTYKELQKEIDQFVDNNIIECKIQN
jgi:ParB-like chromosome segregation protein Spo0J